MTTYHCRWCGWNGTRIGEQKTGDGRYACWQCGLEVRPGPHDPEPGYFQWAVTIAERLLGKKLWGHGEALVRET